MYCHVQVVSVCEHNVLGAVKAFLTCTNGGRNRANVEVSRVHVSPLGSLVERLCLSDSAEGLSRRGGRGPRVGAAAGAGSVSQSGPHSACSENL